MTPSPTELDALRLVKTLKLMLKERKISYQDIARDLRVSLPTVKRMLNKPSLPLERLLAICRIADVDLSEVMTRAEEVRPRHYVFTAEQDALFHGSPEFLAYFTHLTYKGKSPDEIAAEFSLTQRSTNTYLIALSKVGLIERETGNDIKILVEPPFGFGPDSLVLRSRQCELISDITEMVMSPGERKCFAILKPMTLTEELFTEMIEELKSVVDKYAYFSEGPGRAKGPDAHGWVLSIAAGQSVENDSEAAIVNL